MNNEKECLSIENTVLNHPALADVLVPLFSPSTASTNTFLQAYKNIVNHCNAQYEPIALQLLSKVRSVINDYVKLYTNVKLFCSLMCPYAYHPNNLYYKKGRY